MQEMVVGMMMDSTLVLDQAPIPVQLHTMRIMKTKDGERDAPLFCTFVGVKAPQFFTST